MKCPYCNNEMRSGFVQGARGVFFSEEERFIFYISRKSKNDIVIASGWQGCSAVAHYCDNCGVLISKKSDN